MPAPELSTITSEANGVTFYNDLRFTQEDGKRVGASLGSFVFISPIPTNYVFDPHRRTGHVARIHKLYRRPDGSTRVYLQRLIARSQLPKTARVLQDHSRATEIFLSDDFFEDKLNNVRSLLRARLAYDKGKTDIVIGVTFKTCPKVSDECYGVRRLLLNNLTKMKPLTTRGPAWQIVAPGLLGYPPEMYNGAQLVEEYYSTDRDRAASEDGSNDSPPAVVGDDDDDEVAEPEKTDTAAIDRLASAAVASTSKKRKFSSESMSLTPATSSQPRSQPDPDEDNDDDNDNMPRRSVLLYNAMAKLHTHIKRELAAGTSLSALAAREDRLSESYAKDPRLHSAAQSVIAELQNDTMRLYIATAARLRTPGESVKHVDRAYFNDRRTRVFADNVAHRAVIDALDYYAAQRRNE